MINQLKQIVNHVVIYSVGSWMSRFLTFFLLPIYTRIFVPEQYGQLDILILTNSFLGLFLCAGTTQGVSRYFCPEDSEEQRMRIASTGFIFLCMVFPGFIIVLIPFRVHLSRLLLHDVRGGNLVVLALSSGFPSVTYHYMLSLYRYRLLPKRYLMFSLGQLLLNVSLILTLVLVLRFGIAGIFLSQMISFSLMSVAMGADSRRYIRNCFSFSILKDLIQFGLPLVPSSLAMYLMNYSGRYFIGSMRGMHEVGLYGIAYRLGQIVTMITAGFGAAWPPFIYSNFQKPNGKQLFAKILDFYSTGLFLILCGIGLFSEELLRAFATERYYAASGVVPLICIGLGMYHIGGYFPIGIGISKKTYHRLWVGLSASGLNVALNIVLIPKYGIYGSALATINSYLFFATALLWISHRLYPIPYSYLKISLCWLLGFSIVLIASQFFFKSPSSFLSRLSQKLLVFSICLCVPFLIGVVNLSNLKAGIRFIQARIPTWRFKK